MIIRIKKKGRKNSWWNDYKGSYFKCVMNDSGEYGVVHKCDKNGKFKSYHINYTTIPKTHCVLI